MTTSQPLGRVWFDRADGADGADGAGGAAQADAVAPGPLDVRSRAGSHGTRGAEPGSPGSVSSVDSSDTQHILDGVALRLGITGLDALLHQQADGAATGTGGNAKPSAVGAANGTAAHGAGSGDSSGSSDSDIGFDERQAIRLARLDPRRALRSARQEARADYDRQRELLRHYQTVLDETTAEG